jgi:1-phosphofructokinase
MDFLPMVWRAARGNLRVMGESVMVFAPAPLLTVTVEQPADGVELHLHPGGQGVWQARMIAGLGCRVTLCVCIGGEIGMVLRKLLDEERVGLQVVVAQAGSGWYVHDRRTGQRTEVASHPGAPMDRHDIDELYNVALMEGLRAGVGILSGPAAGRVVPSDAYRRLAADLTANGVRVIADLSGEYLAAALAGGVEFVKVGHEDLLKDGRVPDDTVPALLDAGRRIRAEGARSVLISRAADPALLLSGDRAAQVRVPRLQVTEHRGAGDSMTAGVAAVLAGGGDLAEAVRTGAAAGALNVTRHGLGTGRAEAIHELETRVRLEPLPAGLAMTARP